MVLLENCREADPDIGIFHRLRLKALFSVGPLETDEASQGIGKLSDKQDLSLDDIFVGALSLVADNPAGPVVSLIVDGSRQDQPPHSLRSPGRHSGSGSRRTHHPAIAADFVRRLDRVHNDN